MYYIYKILSVKTSNSISICKRQWFFWWKSINVRDIFRVGTFLMEKCTWRFPKPERHRQISRLVVFETPQNKRRSIASLARPRYLFAIYLNIRRTHTLTEVWTSLSRDWIQISWILVRWRFLSMFAPCKRIHEGPGFRIPASPSIWILDSNPLDSGFQPSGFRIPKPLWIPDSSLWIPDSNNKNLLDSGFRIPLHGATMLCMKSYKTATHSVTVLLRHTDY